jgi:predicted transcriptional regulator
VDVAKDAKKAALTRLEMKIMQVIWKRGDSTVSEVQAQLKPELAYTSVQTMLNILARKGKLARKLDGRAYVYAAKVTQERALGQVVSDVVDRIFGGSSEELVMSLLKTRQIDAKSLQALTKRFNAEEKKS